MTDRPVPETLRTHGFTVSPDLDADALFQEMTQLDAARSDFRAGFYWQFSTAAPDDWHADCMMIGVRGDVGALEWFTAETGYVPTNGLNAEAVEYYTWDTHVMVMERGSEVPISTVRDALREYARTGQRPTCVEWRAFDPFEYQP